MSNVPAHIKAPSVAQVRLLPPEVNLRRDRKQQRRTALLMLSVFILVLAGLYYLFALQAKEAEEAALAREDETLLLNQQLAALSYVDAVKARLDNARDAREYAASQEVYWPLVWASISSALPENAVATRVTVVNSNFLGTPSGAEAELDTAGIARVDITVEIDTVEQATELERRFHRIPFFAGARVTAVTNLTETAVSESGEPVSDAPSRFEVSYQVTLTYDALMLRFTEAWYGTEEGATGTSLEDFYTKLAIRVLEGNASLLEFPQLPGEVVPPTEVEGTDAADGSSDSSEGAQ